MKIVRTSLSESLSSDNRYGCVMLFSNVPDWNKLVRRIVKEEDIYIDPEDVDEYGYEENPHITVLYGIHHDDIIDKSLIHKMIKSIPNLSFSVDNINHFSGEQYDVIKFNIPKTPELLKIRKEFETELPNTQTFPNYEPHMTIAYVKKGLGAKYDKLLKKALKFKFDKGVYSDPEYRKDYFDLKSTNYDK